MDLAKYRKEFKEPLEDVLIIDSSFYVKESADDAKHKSEFTPEQRETTRRLKGSLRKALEKLRIGHDPRAIPFVLDVIENELQSKITPKLVVNIILEEILNGRMNESQSIALMKALKEYEEYENEYMRLLAQDFLKNAVLLHFTKLEAGPLGKYRLNILNNRNVSPEIFMMVLGNIEEIIENSDQPISNTEIQDISLELARMQEALKLKPGSDKLVEAILALRLRLPGLARA